MYKLPQFGPFDSLIKENLLLYFISEMQGILSISPCKTLYIIITVTFVITFMQATYNYIPETTHISRVYSVFSCSVFIICATCNVISHMKRVVYCYISTSRRMCVVPNMTGFLIP